MKKIFTVLLMVIACSAFAQQKFTIDGKVGGLDKPAKVYLAFRNTDGGVVRDSALLNNGAFQFRGTTTEITDASLILSHDGTPISSANMADMVFIILENGNIKVSTADSLRKAVVAGTPLNVDYAALIKRKTAAMNKISDLRGKFNTYQKDGKAEEFNKVYGTELTAASDDYEHQDFEYIKTHPNSYMSLLILRAYVNSRSIENIIEPAFLSFPLATRESRIGKIVASEIAKFKAIDVNSAAPEFTLLDTAGTPVSLSSFKGKYVLLDFWASWCKPCRVENPNVIKAYNTFKNKNFTVLGVSLDYPTDKAKWLKAIADDHLGVFTQVSDMKGTENVAAALYNVSAIPQNFLIGPDGKIVAKNLTGTELQKKLTSLFN